MFHCAILKGAGEVFEQTEVLSQTELKADGFQMNKDPVFLRCVDVLVLSLGAVRVW